MLTHEGPNSHRTVSRRPPVTLRFDYFLGACRAQPDARVL